MVTRERRGSWFPLALLGFLTLGSAAITVDGWQVNAHHTSFPLGGEFVTLRGLEMSRDYERQVLTPGTLYPDQGWPPIGSAEYWVVGLSLALIVAIAWYARRSGQAAAYTTAAVCGVVAVGAFSCMMWIVEESPELAPTVAGWLLAIGLCAAGWVYFKVGRGRSTLTAISVMTSVVGATGLLAAWTSHRADAVLLVGALLVLAWWERSWLAAVLAGAVLVIDAVPMPVSAQLVLVTALLFAGAFVTLARKSGPTAAQ